MALNAASGRCLPHQTQPVRRCKQRLNYIILSVQQAYPLWADRNYKTGVVSRFSPILTKCRFAAFSSLPTHLFCSRHKQS